MIRNSHQREVILEELGKVKTHPQAAELYVLVRKRIPNISLGTVYRNLEALSKEGKITKIVCNRFSRFDGNVKLHPHFFCEKCGKVFDVDQVVELKFDRKGLEEKSGLAVSSTNIVVYGLCSSCNMV